MCSPVLCNDVAYCGCFYDNEDGCYYQYYYTVVIIPSSIVVTVSIAVVINTINQSL